MANNELKKHSVKKKNTFVHIPSIIKAFLLLLTSLFLASCLKQVELDIEDFTSNPTVNCLLSPDSLASLHLLYSKQIDNKEEFSLISNAIVEISGASSPSLLEFSENGYYTSDLIPEAKQLYTLKVDMANGSTLSASTRIPSKPNVKVEAIKDLRPPEDLMYSSEDTSHYSITIFDHPEEKEYYWICVSSFVPYKETYETSKNIYSDKYINENIGISIDSYYPDFPYYYSFYLRIDDESFQGEEFNLKIKFDTNHDFTDRITIISADENLDLYLKSAQLQYEQRIVGDNPIFLIPESMYSNIENGSGIFASLNAVNFDFILQSWP